MKGNQPFVSQSDFIPSFLLYQRQKRRMGGMGDFGFTGENSIRYNLINIQKLLRSILMK